jgi:hypothetical protein
MFRRATALTLTFVFANALALAAADNDATAKSATPIGSAVESAAKVVDPSVSLWTLSQTPRRPMMLPALYGTYAVLQAMDVMSTKKAITAGGQEANPVMRGNMGRSIALKAASGAATVYFVEKAWKKSRIGAIVLMAAINSATAAIVAHNTGIARR